VDDTHLNHVDMQVVETIMEAHSCLQQSVIDWGQLLIATGGALKPTKCSYQTSFHSGRRMMVPGCMRTTISIPTWLLASPWQMEPASFLGSMPCPTGSSTAALGQMQQQGQEWVDRVKSGKLSYHSVWFMLDHQFWPHVGYGIYNNSATWDELDKCLKRVY
jgi:hypothetical protein